MEPSLLKSILLSALEILHGNARWMGWNLFLALVPLALSVLLFRHTQLGASTLTLPPIALQSRHRSGLWWVGVVVFVAFLPNAPYILTDVIHFIDDVQVTGSEVWLTTLVIIPLYVLFIFAGFESYVLSLINVGYYLNQRGLRRYVLVMELAVHLLSAIGVYLGRFLRYNSWDLVTRLDDVMLTMIDDLTGKRPLLAIVVIFLLTTALYLPFKQVTLAVAAYSKKGTHSAVDRP
ncbi:DUF1361 domain-containing protein [Phormidesmis sp. 146-35]